jgi:hypothetical protein
MNRLLVCLSRGGSGRLAGSPWPTPTWHDTTTTTTHAGKSLVPLLKDPKGRVKDFAITQIARCCSNGCGKVPVEEVPWQHWEVCRCVGRWKGRSIDRWLTDCLTD